MTSKTTTKHVKLANSAEGGAPSSGQVTAKIRFFLNGLKIDGGRLHKAHLSLIERWTKANGDVVDTHVVLHAPGCSRFSSEVRALFPIENNTELASDYLETDRIRIPLVHRLFNAALAAVMQGVKRDIRRCNKLGRLEDAAAYERELDDLHGVASVAARPLESELEPKIKDSSEAPVRTKLDARDGMYVCPEGGCADIEGTEWVHLNGGKPVGSEPPSEDYWCPACEEHHDRVAILDADGTCAGDACEPFTLDPKRYAQLVTNVEEQLLTSVCHCLAVLDAQRDPADTLRHIRSRLEAAQRAAQRP